MKKSEFIAIEQATYARRGDELPTSIASSGGYQDAWRPAVEKILVDFGRRPAGVACPSAMFARPLNRKLAIVVHVMDLEAGDSSAEAPLGFHVLVVPRDAYRYCINDPFVLTERFAPNWTDTATLPELSWPAKPPPARTVEQIRTVLQRVKGKPLEEDVPGEEQDITTADDAESPVLLGGVQVLVDGGRLLFERSAPDTAVLKALWTLLPSSSRAELWPASFAFSNRLGFDVMVVPRFDAEQHRGYTTEEQAADYPEGKYELHLQVAAEAGDQRELDNLFGRRSSNDTFKLALLLLAVVAALAVVSRFLGPGPPPRVSNERFIRQEQSRLAAAVVGLSHPLNRLTLLKPALEEGTRLKKLIRK